MSRNNGRERHNLTDHRVRMLYQASIGATCTQSSFGLGFGSVPREEKISRQPSQVKRVRSVNPE